MTQFNPKERIPFNPNQTGLGGIFGLGGGPKGLWPPRGGTLMPHIQPQPINQDPWGIKPMGEQITGFEEQLGGYGEQLGGFEESLGGYGEQLGGFEEQLGGYGEQLSGLGDRFGQQLSGLGDRFGGVNDKLSKIEEGIGSLLQNRGSGRGMNMQPNYGYSPYNMLLNSFFGGYR
jgi:hypothetical protein